MKKLIIISITLMIILVLLYFYFKPDSSQSIAELQQESLSDSKNNREQSIPPSSHSENMIDYVNSLKGFIEKAPFKQEDTYSIFTRNPEEIQQYLRHFSSFIEKNIINNSNLSDNQKAEILWKMFKEYNWVGEDNAFKAIIKDNLMYLKNSSLIPEITKTYHDISLLGEKSVNSRHDLLEIINSMDIHSGNTDNHLVVDTLRSELRAINSRNEAQNLGDMVTTILYEYGKTTESNIIPDIIQAANNNTQASLSYINSILKLTLVDTNPNQFKTLIQSDMSQSTKDDLNHAILFNLKGDGDIPLSSVNTESLVLLDQYLNKEFSSNTELKRNADLQQLHNDVVSLLQKD